MCPSHRGRFGIFSDSPSAYESGPAMPTTAPPSVTGEAAIAARIASVRAPGSPGGVGTAVCARISPAASNTATRRRVPPRSTASTPWPAPGRSALVIGAPIH